MSRVVLGGVGAVLAAAWGYYHYLYPPHLMEVATEKALGEFALAVAAHDRGKVAAVLNGRMTDGAKVHLEVTFLSLTQNGSRPVIQDFGKKEFLTFIDNVLYPLDTYSYEPEMTGFVLNGAKDAGEVTFTSREWADGNSHYAAVKVGVRYSSDTACSAHVVFVKKEPFIETADCKVSMRVVPRPEEAHKLQSNPEAMQQLLMR